MKIEYPTGLFLMTIPCGIHGKVYHEIAYSHREKYHIIFTATCPHCRDAKIKPHAHLMKLPILDWNYIVNNLQDEEDL